MGAQNQAQELMDRLERAAKCRAEERILSGVAEERPEIGLPHVVEQLVELNRNFAILNLAVRAQMDVMLGGSPRGVKEEYLESMEKLVQS